MTDMKKMNFRKYTAALLLLGVAVTSCKKSFLDRRPEDALVDANFYQTPEQVLAGSAPLYNVVWFAYNDKASYGLGDGRGGTLMSGSQQRENINLQTTAVTGEVGSAWRAFFNVVGQANSVINNITKYAGAGVPENIKQSAIAEGRFMRGVAYAHLVMNWGAVPIITDNSKVITDTSIRRNTVETVWEFVIRDLRFAVENLPEMPLQKGRLSRWSAKGMLAKMYLTRAGITGTRRQADLDSAAKYAKDVIDNSGLTLMQNYEDLFKTENNNNPESLFSLQWKYDGDWGNQNSVQAYLAFGSEITGFSDGWGGDVGGSHYILKKYAPQDKRRKATFMFPGEHYSYIHQAVDDPANPGKKIIKELDVPTGTVSGQRANTRAWVKKYVVGRPEDNAGKVGFMRTEINTYMLRLADVYLVYAEAVLGTQASTSDANALRAFNAVHTRAGLAPVTSITWDDIYNERFLEFALEGQAWYDLVRLNYYNPTKAQSIIASQDKGTYTIKPNTLTNATSWEITSVTPAFYSVTAANFNLPYPASDMAAAPNLRAEPVPYKF